MTYEDKRDPRLENEIFLRVDPRYPQMGDSISLILSGEVISDTGSAVIDSDFNVDIDSIRNNNYILRGVGFPLAPYEDTLRNCVEVWIPIEDNEGNVQELKFVIKKRSSYRNWIYLWNYDDDALTIPGAWVADGFQLAEEPYSEIGTRPELDYQCVVAGPNKSIIFVYYEPSNFRYNGTYNATLNNAFSESKDNLYLISASVKLKKYVSDYHKIPGIGGHAAGEFIINQATDKEIVRVQDFREQFKSRAEQYGDEGLQTLDLAFMSFRAISASIYVDRLDTNVSAAIEKVWDDIQEGNTDDPVTVYFIPRCSMVETGSVASYVDFMHTTTVPTIGDLIFSVDVHTPVRFVEATLYAPFLNRVYRTDKFGAIVEEFPQSDFSSSTT